MFISRLRFLLGVAMLALPIFCNPAFADQETLSANAQKSNAYILANTQSHKTYTLNLAEPTQQQHALDTLAKAGKTPQNSPQLFKVVNATIKNHNTLTKSGLLSSAPTMVMASVDSAPQDLNTIIDFEETNTSTGSYSSTAMSSIVGGTNSSTITVNITSPDGKTVYGTNSQSQSAQGTEFMVTATATNVPADVTPITSATFVYVPTIASTNAVSASATNAVTATATATLMQPAGGNSTMTVPNYCTAWSGPTTASTCTSYKTGAINTGATTLTPIYFCYQRGGTNSCDYFNPTLPYGTSFMAPSAGTATFTTAVDPSISGTWTAQVWDANKGGGCVLSQDAAIASPQWTIPTSNPNEIDWKISQLSLNNATACLSYTNGEVLNFVFTGKVKLTGTGTNSQGTFRFTSNTQDPSGRGIFFVPQFDFEDSCLAKGTLVTMAKGKAKPVEKITADNHDVIKSENGIEKEVQGTSHGTEHFPMFQITTDQKQTVLLTRTHPILTANGFVMARDLKVKDVVKTIKGTAKIKSIKQVKYSGTVHNLRLGSIEDAKKGTSTFYANGILVGDLKTQTHYENLERESLKKDPEHACDRLPAEWKVDGGCVNNGKK